MVYVEDSSFDGVNCMRLDVEYVDGKGFTCSPVGSDVFASEHVQHALVGLAAEEAAVVVGEVVVPVLGVDGTVEETAPVLLFGRVRERRAKSSPDLHPAEAVDRAIPSAGPVRFAVGPHIPSDARREDGGQLVDVERSLSRRSGWLRPSFRTVWSRASQRGKALVTGPMIAARSSGVSSSSPAKGCL